MKDCERNLPFSLTKFCFHCFRRCAPASVPSIKRWIPSCPAQTNSDGTWRRLKFRADIAMATCRHHPALRIPTSWIRKVSPPNNSWIRRAVKSQHVIAALNLQARASSSGNPMVPWVTEPRRLQDCSSMCKVIQP